MKSDFKNKAHVLDGFFKTMKTLRDEGILINNKDFTCQIGEWLVEMLYSGRREQQAAFKKAGMLILRACTYM